MAMWNPWRGCHKHNVELVVVGGESDRNARPLDYAWYKYGSGNVKQLKKTVRICIFVFPVWRG